MKCGEKKRCSYAKIKYTHTQRHKYTNYDQNGERNVHIK